MKQILIDLDAATAARLDQAVPPKTRKRAEFVRGAIRKALWELEERATAAAYARKPDAEPGFFAPEVWEAPTPPARRAHPPRRRSK